VCFIIRLLKGEQTMTDTEKQAIQKVLDKFAQVHCIGHPNKWDDLETGLHISYDGAKILATLTYRAGRESRDAEKIERLKEIIKIANKLGWIMKLEKGMSYPPMQLSEVEKCMLAMVDDFELKRMREWEKDEDKKHASQRGDDVNYELSGKFSINNFTFNPTTSNL
jgi:hypothetical protein